MIEQRQIEEMAKIDGGFEYVQADAEGNFEKRAYYKFPPNQSVYAEYFNNGMLPAYLTSHDACQRVIDGLDDVQLSTYRAHLVVITDSYGWNSDRFLKATPAQKVEAILKAKGVWRDELDNLIASEEYLNEEG